MVFHVKKTSRMTGLQDDKTYDKKLTNDDMSSYFNTVNETRTGKQTDRQTDRQTYRLNNGSKITYQTYVQCNVTSSYSNGSDRSHRSRHTDQAIIRTRRRQCAHSPIIWFLGCQKITPQMASRSVHPFLQGSWSDRPMDRQTHRDKSHHSVFTKRPHLCYACDAA